MLFAILRAESSRAIAVLALGLWILIFRAGKDLVAHAIDKRVPWFTDALLVAFAGTIEIADSKAVLANHLGYRVGSTMGNWFATAINAS